MCSGATFSETIGDRICINQMPGGIKKMVPLTATEAQNIGYQAGSCMAKMGQHWIYDLEAAPRMSWVSGNMMPIIPMYNTLGPNTGLINAFLFTSPVC